jgi:predicted transcriptional regulator
MAEQEKLSLVANVAASYLRRNSVGIDQIGAVFSSVTRALGQASRELEGGAAEEAQPAAAPVEEKRAPAVPVRRSVHRDYIVCLECGVKARTLKRHLQTAHSLVPQQYREKWSLPRDYPMVAPAYSERRSQMAKDLGLGRKGAAARGGSRRGKGRGAASGG